MRVKTTARILKADTLTSNQRVYPMSVLQKIVEQYKNDPVYGQVGMSYDRSISLADVSHKVSNLRIEDGYLVGDVETLDTPQGRLLAQMLDAPHQFRTAGTGIINEDGVIADDFILHSINAVTDGAELE